jgi:putative membrane protein
VPLSTAATATSVAFGRNRLLHLLLAGYGVLWVGTAVAARSRPDWAMENLLVVSLLAALAGTYRVLALSDLSYLCIAGFLALHAVGAQYGYTEVPLGRWAREEFGWGRNHYDRLVHFAFGLLMTYPARELLLRAGRVRGVWGYALPLAVVVALGAAYEVLEWGASAIMAPQLGATFLGAQGDPWDAQKDMLAAALGALGALAAVGAVAVTAAARARRHGL